MTTTPGPASQPGRDEPAQADTGARETATRDDVQALCTLWATDAREDLRDQIDAALRRVGLARNLSAYRDEVMPVVEASLACGRASCCADGERTYGEMERHLTERAEQAVQERDTAHRMMERIPDVHMRFGVVGVVDPEDAACADWCYACRLAHAEERATQAEAAVQRVRPLLARAIASSWEGTPAGDAVREALAALDQPEGT